MDELDVKNWIPPIIDLFIFSKKDTYSAQGFTYNLATIHISLSLSLSLYTEEKALISWKKNGVYQSPLRYSAHINVS